MLCLLHYCLLLDGLLSPHLPSLYPNTKYKIKNQNLKLINENPNQKKEDEKYEDRTFEKNWTKCTKLGGFEDGRLN